MKQGEAAQKEPQHSFSDHIKNVEEIN